MDSKQGQELLKQLESNYKKAAFWRNSYKQLNLPDVAVEPLSLPSDKWNQGFDHRIEIPVGAKIRLITDELTDSLGVYGRDADLLLGLWVSEFEYQSHN